MLFTLCFTAMAQSKLTPQAQMSVERSKAKAVRQSARANVPQPEQRLTLVVKVGEKDAAATFRQMKAMGIEVKSKLGRQAVVSVPISRIDALQQIEGISRIDTGHKGRLKTDVTREVSGVNLLNGPSLSAEATAYTGKDVVVALIDVGFDFQHPAFKDSEGRSRIKCVYRINDDGGHKFTVNDPEAGEYTFPGSVYDTPELIATLTNDGSDEYHGSHTAGIAAGSLSPQGFGGMAPEADIVLIPLADDEVEGVETLEEYLEIAFGFVAAYAEQSDKPVVLNASMNSHGGPHDGTSTVTEMIEDLSESLIPVFSAGNEGGFPIHLYQEFTDKKQSVNTVLGGMMEDETGEYELINVADVYGRTRQGDEVSLQLSVCTVNMMGKLNAQWTSEKVTATTGGDDVTCYVSSEDDATLANTYEGEIELTATDNGDGTLSVGLHAEGGMKKLAVLRLTVSGSDGTAIDLWDDYVGFAGTQFLGLPGLVDGDSEMSAGDWTCTDRVVSVGAYCANTNLRSYDGSVKDTSVTEDEDEEPDVLNDIATFSSYGTSFNDITQPTITAPGVNIVSSWNSSVITGEVAEGMQWMDGAYGAESGTSMAAPVVTGIVALWLQADPTMTLDDVKNVMSHSAVNDKFTAKNTIRWGYGKINAAKGIEYIMGQTGISQHSSTATRQNPSTVYDLQGRAINRRPSKGLYIVNGRKYVVR